MTRYAQKPVQAKHLSDDAVLAAIVAVRRPDPQPAYRWASLWDVQRRLAHVPAKVVTAKLRSLVKRRVLDGCTCGCRGDFWILAEATP